MQNCNISRDKFVRAIPVKGEVDLRVLSNVKISKKNDQLFSRIQPLRWKQSWFLVSTRNLNKALESYIYHAQLWLRMVCLYDYLSCYWHRLQSRKFYSLAISLMCFSEIKKTFQNQNIFEYYQGNRSGNFNPPLPFYHPPIQCDYYHEWQNLWRHTLWGSSGSYSPSRFLGFYHFIEHFRLRCIEHC